MSKADIGELLHLMAKASAALALIGLLLHLLGVVHG